MALTARFGSFQPFLRANSRDDERYGGLQAGFVTYHGEGDDETYKVSYAEVGGRSDHLAQPISNVMNAGISDLKTSTPLADDSELLQAKPEDKADKAAA